MVTRLVIGGIVIVVGLIVAMGAWLFVDSLRMVARDVFGIDLDLADGHGGPADRV